MPAVIRHPVLGIGSWHALQAKLQANIPCAHRVCHEIKHPHRVRARNRPRPMAETTICGVLQGFRRKVS